MAETNDIREYVKSVCPNDKWSKMVDHMTNHRVLEIYKRFQNLQANPNKFFNEFVLPDYTKYEQTRMDI